MSNDTTIKAKAMVDVFKYMSIYRFDEKLQSTSVQSSCKAGTARAFVFAKQIPSC